MEVYDIAIKDAFTSLLTFCYIFQTSLECFTLLYVEFNSAIAMLSESGHWFENFSTNVRHQERPCIEN